MPQSEEFVTSIRNITWMVRHYSLQRTRHNRLRRAQAVLKLGLVVREAFARSNDYEALLEALVEGLRPSDKPPF